ncbi:MAG: cell wall metabolism sensor histidine kinase WalK [Candidatus Eremiobacteraeota bacterium]|nr:cell wall metabolism sensor histidine kinase WalK [Candidatus Eremiobacteraeota bacterium]
MFKNIRSKLILSYILLIVISMTLTVLFLHWSMKNTLEKELVKQVKYQCKTYSDLIYSRITGPEDFASRAKEVVSEFVPGKNYGLTVYNIKGQTLAGSHEGKTELPPDALIKLKAGKAIHWYESVNGDRMLHVATPISSFGSESTTDGYLGIIDLATPLAQIDSTYQGLRNQLLIAIAISVALTLLISLILAQTLTKPISQIEKVTGHIAEGNFSTRVDYGGQDEIRSLADTINYMSAKIEANIEEILGEKNKMNALLSAMPEGVIALDRNGEIRFLNSAAYKFLIINNDEVVTGRKLFDTWKEKEVEEFFREGVDKAGIYMREIAIPPRILKLYLVPFGEREHAVSGMMMIIRDITDLRRLEETRTRFLSSISHELRTPLTIIKGFIHTIIDEPPIAQNKQTSDALHIMDGETDRLTRLVNELMELSRLRSKKLTFEMETLRADKIVESTVQSMKNNAERMNISIELHNNAGEAEILGDHDRLKQVVINLIDNAIKYTPGKGKVTVRTHIKDNRWILDVEDTGMGISKDELPFLFERFFRTKDRNKKKYIKGTGLGMAIVKEIVDAHNGKITVDSVEGKGTKIHISIPLERADNG